MCPAFLTDGSHQYNRARKIHPRDSVSQLGYYLSGSTISSSSDSSCRRAKQAQAPSSSTTSADQWQDVESQSSAPGYGRGKRLEEREFVEAQGQVIAGYARSAARLGRNLLGRRAPDELPASSGSERGGVFATPSDIGAGGGSCEGEGEEKVWFNLRNRRPAGKQKSRQSKEQTIGETPLESSGFSDGTNTLTELAFEEHHGKGAHLVGLGDANRIRAAYWPTSGPNLFQSGHMTKVDNADVSRHMRPQFVYEKGGSSELLVADASGYIGELVQNSADSANVRAQSRKQITFPRGANRTRMKRRNVTRLNRRMLVDGNDHLVNPYALSELFSQSEIPGFREIFASDSYLRKFCWVVAFLFMTVLSLNDMTELITEYYEYPITVDLRLRDSARLPFPSVTVCNLNVVRFSALCSYSSSSSPSSRFNLTNQIPSELRDKLCGIQVEKKNTSGGDSDINDINNIGITTTKTTATTISSATATASSTGISAAGSTISVGGASPSSPIAGSTFASWAPSGGGSTPPTNGDSMDPAGQLYSKGSTSANSPTKWPNTKPADEQSTRQGAWPGFSAAPDPDKPLFTSVASTQVAATASTMRQPTSSVRSNGGLDLGGDFTDAPMLVLDGHLSGDLRQVRRTRRSFRLGPEGFSGMEDSQQQQRPFAPSRSRMKIAGYTSTMRRYETPATVASMSASRLHQLSEASQFLQPPISVQGNRANNIGPGKVADGSGYGLGYGYANNNNPLGQQPAAHGTNRNGVPVNPLATVTTLKNYQNPLLNGGSNGAGQVQSSTSTPAPSSSSATTPASSFVPPALPEDFELTERQERELQENLTNWLAVMNNRDPELTWSLGHQFDDMILRCTMKSINCTHQRSFENSFTPTEGNCFTYRSKIRRRVNNGVQKSNGGSQFEEANLASINHGLELVLNLEKNEYISGSSQVGALVMVHHPNDLGYAASEATFVAPEFTTYIGLKMVNITRLPAPYPEYCVDSWPKLFAETLTRNSTYSQQACLRICLQTTIQSHCHCQSAFLPIVELDGNTATAAHHQHQQVAASNSSEGAQVSHEQQQQRIIICDTRKQATRQCVREVMLRAADRVHNCECPPKCQVVRYDKTISMARWPTREDKVSFDRGKMDVNFQNLAKVIVYFQTMTCDEVTQQAVFNAAKLFSALGGIMGMYVGFSFLSVFEIFEVMSRKIWHHFTSKLANTRSRLINNMRA